jgi:hypothetical protein
VSEEETPKTFTALLSQFGLSSEFLQRVRFRGPVGKLSLIGIFCIVGLGGVGIRTSSPIVAGLCAVLATVVALAISGAVLWYSHVHPNEAMLEGMEVVAMQQQRFWAEAAAKGVPASMSLDAPISNPTASSPEIE